MHALCQETISKTDSCMTHARKKTNMTQYKVLQSYKKIATPSRLPPKAIARQFFDYQFIFCNSLKSIHRNTLSSCEKIVFLLFCMEVRNASIGPAMGCIRVLRLEVLFPMGKSPDGGKRQNGIPSKNPVSLSGKVCYRESSTKQETL